MQTPLFLIFEVKPHSESPKDLQNVFFDAFDVMVASLPLTSSLLHLAGCLCMLGLSQSYNSSPSQRICSPHLAQVLVLFFQTSKMRNLDNMVASCYCSTILSPGCPAARQRLICLYFRILNLICCSCYQSYPSLSLLGLASPLLAGPRRGSCSNNLRSAQGKQISQSAYVESSEGKRLSFVFSAGIVRQYQVLLLLTIIGFYKCCTV